jgi:hypothetical protein
VAIKMGRAGLSYRTVCRVGATLWHEVRTPVASAKTHGKSRRPAARRRAIAAEPDNFADNTLMVSNLLDP